MENKGYFMEEDMIVINRELTELDKFVKDFLEVLKKHSDYLIVSGFVSICSGRTRATEDVDILVPAMNKENFEGLFNDLIKNNFWCYQGDSVEELYTYVENLNSIRFAKVNEMFPNMEVVFFNETKKAKFCEFNNPQKIKIRNFEFKIPPIEFEILYKEIILTGKKDIEDARDLRTFFEDILKEENFKKYEGVIKGELKRNS